MQQRMKKRYIVCAKFIALFLGYTTVNVKQINAR